MAEIQKIPASYRDLFKKRSFAHLATLMADGSPQVTPVWVDYDGEYVIVNTSRGRQKAINMERNGRVAIDIVDPDNPYRYVTIRGRVAEATEKGADQSIDQLSARYTGNPKYQNRTPGEVRVIFKIAPEHVKAQG